MSQALSFEKKGAESLEEAASSLGCPKAEKEKAHKDFKIAEKKHKPIASYFILIGQSLNWFVASRSLSTSSLSLEMEFRYS